MSPDDEAAIRELLLSRRFSTLVLDSDLVRASDGSDLAGGIFMVEDKDKYRLIYDGRRSHGATKGRTSTM